jgi:hypothetical protein
MSRSHGSRVEWATRPLPRFRSCSIDITACLRAVTEQRTPTAAEAEDDEAGPALGFGHVIYNKYCLLVRCLFLMAWRGRYNEFPKPADAAGHRRMDSRRFARDEESDDCGCGATSTARFRRTIAELEKSWAAEARNTPFYPFVTWTPDGPLLGAATPLARNGRSEDDRLLVLLSVAHARDVPADALKHLAWAEREFHRGDLVKSAMHVALTGLPALVGSGAAASHRRRHP